MQDRTRVKNKIRMKFHQLGLIDYDENHRMSHKLVKEILSRTTSRELIVVIQAYWRIWKSLDQEIRHIEQELKKQAQTDPNEPTYLSAPGVGTIERPNFI